MRIFSYILATLVTIFVLNIALSFSLPSYRNTLVNTRTSIFPVTKKTLDIPMVDEKISESARLVESLDRIDKHIESLNEAKKTEIETINTESTSGTVISLIDTLPKEPEILLSGIFLSKIMPEVMVKKIDNSWFFGIQVMGKILYNTYFDEKRNIKVYAFADTYDTILLNMKLTSSVYTLNETDQFFWYTFFLNQIKKDPKDTTVRFITALEGRAIGVEVPKSYYPTLKTLLLKSK